MNVQASKPNDTPADVAEAITRKSASTLWFVGRFLPAPKKRLFEASYASMRVVDDFVDDDFLTRNTLDRSRTRTDAEAFVVSWLDQAKAALNDPEKLQPDHVHGVLFEALSQASVGSDIPIAPWKELARAMIFDVRERPLNTWDEFLFYCEGATVAPASVFLYVLQARDNNGLQAGLCGDALADQARDMALFCYLTHIRRDFAKDAARGGQLMTLPDELLSGFGVSKDYLKEFPEAGMPLLEELGERAEFHRVGARRSADQLMEQMNRAERLILQTLLSVYEGMHRKLSDHPLPGGTQVSRWTDELRVAALKALGGADP